ncbi:MAG: EAL domain-containing protein [Aquisalimonadaceae bacterium]
MIDAGKGQHSKAAVVDALNPGQAGESDHNYHDYLREIMDGLSPSVFVGLLTTGGALLYANRAALEAIGGNHDKVLGKHFAATPWWAFSASLRRRLRKAIRQAAKGESSRFDMTLRDSAGRLRVMDFTLHPVYGRQGQILYLVPSAHDVTDRIQAEQALRMTQFAVDHAQGIVFQMNADGRVRYVNESACRHLGYAREELVGMPVHEIDPRIAEGDWPALWDRLKAQRSVRLESIHRHRDGHGIPVEISANYFEYEGEEYSFVYVDDISERKATEERIRHLAYYDSVTGLPNRILLCDRLNQAIDSAGRSGQQVIVLFIGLDRFKLVNSVLGHAGGDEVLRIAATRLVAAIDQTDTVARIGGDEFAMVLSGPRAVDPTRTARRILDAIAQPVDVAGQELFVTCSIGAAIYPDDGTDADELLKHACTALHRAKAQGRNDVHAYTPDPGGWDPEWLPLEAGLRKALQRGEFELHYQPRIDLRTGGFSGTEALLRWRHPDKGMLLPARFIPIAEETGLILPIGEWVLQAACLQQRVWLDKGVAPAHIGVNISARQFRQPDLARHVARVLQETGVDPCQLEIELTESMLIQDVDSAIHAMSELKDMGVHIALDDFGTGYSSLSYLRRFPIDTLKIDRSFVSEITSDQSSAAIADAIIAMAHRLGMTVIAEGVETTDQLDILRGSGCDHAQGYLFSRPLPADALTQGLAQGLFAT